MLAVRARASALVAVCLLTSAPVFADPERAPADGGLPAPARPKVRVAPRATPPIPATITTGFDASIDGFPFENMGDVATPDGVCAGMSILAIANFDRRRATGLAPARNRPDADLVTQEIVGYTQAIALRADYQPGQPVPAPRSPLDDPRDLRDALLRIARTGRPEILIIGGPNGSHATVLHGYRNGALQIYDPNYPGEVVAWPFDPARGLGPHPKAADSDLYRGLRYAGAAPPEGFRVASASLPYVRAACENGAADCRARYPTVETQLVPDGRGGFAITGRVAGGPTTLPNGDRRPDVSHVAISLNGQSVPDAPVARDGTFRVSVPASQVRAGANALQVVARTKGNQFAGYTQVQVTPGAASAAGPTPTTGLTGVLTGATGR